MEDVEGVVIIGNRPFPADSLIYLGNLLFTVASLDSYGLRIEGEEGLNAWCAIVLRLRRSVGPLRNQAIPTGNLRSANEQASITDVQVFATVNSYP